ncbi:MAG: glycosyltransferase family 9 protein [Candidatus Omnitrophica bacterium]|nr:glycosyltransferase family 9 protein [Candidatus Omnitrophota bacterium]
MTDTKRRVDKPIPFLLAYNQDKLRRGFVLEKILNFFWHGPKNQAFAGDPAKILVIQSHLIGDVMMAIPFLRALRKRYPNAEITFLANDFARGLLEGCDFIDVMLTAPFPWGIRSYHVKNLWKLAGMVLYLRRQKFDLAIDAQIDFRNIFLMFLAGARRRLGYDIVGGRLFLTDIPEFPRDVVHLLEGRLSVLLYVGADIRDKSYRLTLTPDARQWLDAFWRENGLTGKEVVAIHPGASTKEKLWNPGCFVRVIRWLRERNYVPVLVAGPQDEAAAGNIQGLAGGDILVLKTSLARCMAFLSRSRLLVCLDSAASHLASAIGTPAVVLYGPQWPFLAKPFDDHIAAVWNEHVDCRPCVYTKCRKPGHDCMEGISVQDVCLAMERLLDKTASAFSRCSSNIS